MEKEKGEKYGIESPENYHFQVNLRGMLDILSNHLYSSPHVFWRELLQNSVDAITMRQKTESDWSNGWITISLGAGNVMEFQDNGAGLTEEEIHTFLSVLGQSSKTDLENGTVTKDYIGRFGIGLLSCFMVSDTIEVRTRSQKSETGYLWKGLPDGTYTLKSWEKAEVGTTVILKAKADSISYFQPQKVVEFIRYYGLCLPVPVYLSGNLQPINHIPAEFTGFGQKQMLSFGQWLFGEEFFDAIPIQTNHLRGVAYVLPYRTDVSVKTGHRIYLKQMLLTEQGEALLPPWAFFLRCFLDTRNLRPTASRQDFFEDKELEQARQEFEEAIKYYLQNLAQRNPQRLQNMIGIHAQAIKALAVWDDSLFALCIDYLQFETSFGILTGAELKAAEKAVWVNDVSKFKQLKPLFMAQERLLICAAYTYDGELIPKMAAMYSLPMEALQQEGMNLVLEDVDGIHKKMANPLLEIANEALESFDCRVELRQFLPEDMPTLYAMNDDLPFLRQIEAAKENANSIFSQALSALLESVEEQPVATLYLNLYNPLIRRLLSLKEEKLLPGVIRILYVQALLTGGHPLHHGERKMMNEELLQLLEEKTRETTEKIF